MNEHPERSDEWLDGYLDRSTPKLREVVALDDEVRGMLSRIAADARPARVNVRRRVSLGVGLGLLLVGAGAVTAGAVNGVAANWIWWADETNADAIVTYTLPSGNQCELHLGQMVTSETGNPNRPIDDSLLDPDFANWMRSTELLQQDRVDDALDNLAARSGVDVSGLSTDDAYSLAVQIAVDDVLIEEVERRGLREGLAGGAELHCEGEPG